MTLCGADSPHREAWAEMSSHGKELTSRFLLLSNELAMFPAWQGMFPHLLTGALDGQKSPLPPCVCRDS